MNLLFVDDDPDLRAMCAEILTHEGYDVVEAETAEDAIARTASWRPQVVVTDVNMPGKTGVELCAYFTHDYLRPSPLVVVVSGVAAAEDEARRSGASAFLTKPFATDELVLTLRSALTGAPAAAELQHFADQRARTRAAARAMADAVSRTGLLDDTRPLERMTHIARWFGGFYQPSMVAVLLQKDDALKVYTSNHPELAEPALLPHVLVAVAESVIETGTSVMVADAAKQPWLGSATIASRSLMAAPICFNEAPVGVLCAIAPTPAAFAASDVAILEYLTAGITSAVISGKPILLSESWLLARDTFRTILEIETNAAAVRGESIAIALLRLPAERSLASLLERLPSRRMLLGELADDVVGVFARATQGDAGQALRAVVAQLRARATVRASCQLFIGGPSLPTSVGRGVLSWAEHLLNVTAGRPPDRSHIVVDASPSWWQ